MKVGIFAKTFPGEDPRTVLRAARLAGYASAQYNLACSGLGPLPREVGPGAVQAIREAVAETGVTVAAISATYNMVHPEPAVRERGRRGFAAIAAAARSIGSDLLTVCTGSRDTADQWRHHPDNQGGAAWRELCRECHLLLGIAEEHDVRIGVEPELANVVNSAPRAREFIEAMGSDRIGVVLDPANLFETGEPTARRRAVEAAVALLGDRLVLAHAKDRRADGTFAPAGRGVIDFEHYLGCLRAAGFGGSLVAHGLEPAEASGVATFLSDLLGRPEVPR